MNVVEYFLKAEQYKAANTTAVAENETQRRAAKRCRKRS
jgi:hypothetical protein